MLATSQKDVNQSVGRAMRKLLENGDLRPLIIDFSDNLSSFKNHARIRKTFYKQCKYIIEDYQIDDNVFLKDDNEINISDCLKTDPVEIIVDDCVDCDDNDGEKNNKKDDKDNNKDDKKPEKINKLNLRKRMI